MFTCQGGNSLQTFDLKAISLVIKLEVQYLLKYWTLNLQFSDRDMLRNPIYKYIL